MSTVNHPHRNAFVIVQCLRLICAGLVPAAALALSVLLNELVSYPQGWPRMAELFILNLLGLILCRWPLKEYRNVLATTIVNWICAMTFAWLASASLPVSINERMGGMVLSLWWYWLPMTTLLYLLVLLRLRWRPVYRDGLCARCGYDLLGLSTRRCPECGTRFAMDTIEQEEDQLDEETGHSSNTDEEETQIVPVNDEQMELLSEQISQTQKLVRISMVLSIVAVFLALVSTVATFVLSKSKPAPPDYSTLTQQDLDFMREFPANLKVVFGPETGEPHAEDDLDLPDVYTSGPWPPVTLEPPAASTRPKAGVNE